MRIDKWLWAARFFKTRSLVQQAVESAKVRLNKEGVKPAKIIKFADIVNIRIGTQEWEVRVLAFNEKRGSATQAQALYEHTAESLAKREAETLLRQSTPAEPAKGRHGRPTKRDRRQLEFWLKS